MDHKIELLNSKLLGSFAYIESQVLNGIKIKTTYSRQNETYKVEYIDGNNSAIVRFYISRNTQADKYSPNKLRQTHNIYLSKFYEWQGADPYARPLDIEELDPITKHIIQDLRTESLVNKYQPVMDYKILDYSKDHDFVGVDMVHYSNLARIEKNMDQSTKALHY